MRKNSFKELLGHQLNKRILCLLWLISVWYKEICVNALIAKIDPSMLKTPFKWIIFFPLHSIKCSTNEGWYSSCFTTLGFSVFIITQDLTLCGSEKEEPPSLFHILTHSCFFNYQGALWLSPGSSSFSFSLAVEDCRGLFSDRRDVLGGLLGRNVCK